MSAVGADDKLFVAIISVAECGRYDNFIKTAPLLESHSRCMDSSTKHTVSFRSKAAELRAAAGSYANPELRTGILELAERWEELARRIEAEAMKTSGAERQRR